MTRNPLGLKRLHHVELWVGNAKQSAYYYRNSFGFSQLAYSGLETGERRQASYVLAQGKARFVLSTPLDPDGPAAEHVRLHGDGVRDIALEVEDVDFAFAEALRRGAQPAEAPRDLRDEHGAVRRAAIRTYGDTIHSFVAPREYHGPFLPGYVPAAAAGRGAGIVRVDHIVGNVELGRINEWAGFYENVLGFSRYMSFDDKDISTEYSALMSIVMADSSHTLKFPLNEPAPARRKSQIQEYLECYRGPGVQHIALQCADVIQTVATLRGQGIEFLEVPDSYYDRLERRVGAIDEPIAALRELGVLVDRDDEGYLLQIFTKPVGDRPTLFFEIIQRKGCRGFGKGNFKALFEALEAEQARRGNL